MEVKQIGNKFGIMKSQFSHLFQDFFIAIFNCHGIPYFCTHWCFKIRLPLFKLNFLYPHSGSRESPPPQDPLLGLLFSPFPGLLMILSYSWTGPMLLLKKTGALLNPDTKLKSAILDGLAETIIKYKVYLSDREFDEVAEALVTTHPCLKEPGSVTGYGGWKTSLISINLLTTEQNSDSLDAQKLL